MIQHPAFPVEPWSLRESTLHRDMLAQTESIFALANGHIGWRANLDEGEPHGLPGSYLNGLFELRPLPYAEAGFGYPESGETMINVTNGKVIRLLVDDEPFDIRYGQLLRHERVLDFRAGTLSPAGRLGVARRAHGAGHLGPDGLLHPALYRRYPVPGRIAGRPGPHRAAIGTGRQRGTAAGQRRSPGRGRPGSAAGVDPARARGRAGRADAPDQAQRPVAAGGHGPPAALRRGPVPVL